MQIKDTVEMVSYSSQTGKINDGKCFCEKCLFIIGGNTNLWSMGSSGVVAPPKNKK